MSNQHEELNPELIDPSTRLLQEVLKGRASVERFHDPEKRKQAELTQSSLESVAVSIHDLHELSLDEQISVLDNVVDSVFDQDEEAQTTIAKIRDARAAHDEEAIKKLTQEQKERFMGIRRGIASALGVEIEDTDKENQDYRAALLERVTGLGDASEVEIMRQLGFLKVSPETGEEHFTFPEDVFPPHIVEKWHNYEVTIDNHLGAKKKFDRALDDNSDEVVQMDALRRYAHNNLSKSVQEFLSLEDWDFERVRKFIAKLVEQRFPTVATKESEVTSRDVISRLRAIKALGKVTFIDD